MSATHWEILFWLVWSVVVLLLHRRLMRLERGRRELAFEKGAACGGIAVQINPTLLGEEIIAGAYWVDHCHKVGKPTLLAKLCEQKGTK